MMDVVPEESNAEMNKAAADEIMEIFQRNSGEQDGDMSLNELKKLIKGTEIAPTPTIIAPTKKVAGRSDRQATLRAGYRAGLHGRQSAATTTGTNDIGTVSPPSKASVNSQGSKIKSTLPMGLKSTKQKS